MQPRVCNIRFRLECYAKRYLPTHGGLKANEKEMLVVVVVVFIVETQKNEKEQIVMLSLWEDRQWILGAAQVY